MSTSNASAINHFYQYLPPCPHCQRCPYCGAPRSNYPCLQWPYQQPFIFCNISGPAQ